MKKGDIVSRENNLKCPNCSSDLKEIYQGNIYVNSENGRYDEEISKYVCKKCGNIYQGRFLLEDESYLELLCDGKSVKKKKVRKIIIAALVIVIFFIVGFNCINGLRNTTSYRNMNSTTNISNFSNFKVGLPFKYTYYSGDLEIYGKRKIPDCIENSFVRTFDEYKEYISQYEGEIETRDGANLIEFFNEDYFSNHTLAIEVHDGTLSHNTYEIKGVNRTKNTVNINISLERRKYGGVFSEHLAFTFIELDKDVEYVNFNITTTEINNIQDAGTCYKPVIYLYPIEETNVKVKLGYKDNITVSYPEYKDGWNVLAKPNGRLVDLDTNRELYSLYYECDNAIKFDMTDEGFVVKGEKIVPFLEEKLSLLGLSDVEAEEFIIYWLPILKENKYNYIRFATEEEINQNMPLSIDKSPDSIIRVLMIYKALEEEIEVSEQVLESPVREGFTVVEWGVTEIK